MPGHLLRRCEHVHTSLWGAQVGADVTSVQYGVLAALEGRPGIGQRALAELVGLDRSSMAEVVARLNQGGWIARQRSAADGRRDELTLTIDGLLRIGPLHSRVMPVQERLFELSGSPDRAALLDGLRRLARVDRPQDEERFSALDLPGHLLRRAQQAHTAIWVAEFGQHPTGPQYALLHCLRESGETGQATACAFAGLDRSTGADVVDRLVRRSSVVRRRDPSDRRGSLLTLTDEAASAVAAMLPRVVAVQERLLEPVLERARGPLLADLDRLAFRDPLRADP